MSLLIRKKLNQNAELLQFFCALVIRAIIAKVVAENARKFAPSLLQMLHRFLGIISLINYSSRMISINRSSVYAPSMPNSRFLNTMK